MIERQRTRPPESSSLWATAFRAREGYQRSWLVIPSLYVLGAVVLGMVLPSIESPSRHFLGLRLEVSSTQGLLEAIAAGMITFTGMVVSIAVLVVQFGAGQYTPRLVLWFRRDPLVKHSLGLFVAPAVFSLVALYGLDQHETVMPNVTVTFAMFLLVVAIIAFFVMVGRLLDLLRPRKLYQRLALATHHSVDVVYPLTLDKAVDLPDPPQGNSVVVTHVDKDGVFSAIDRHRLLRVAEASDARIDLLFDVGSFLPQNAPIALVHGTDSVNEASIRKAVITADERTITQDPAYGIRAIVDIAIRALSPAVNDPTTAVQALDALESLLHHISHRQLGTAPLLDSGGTVRVVMPAAGWDELLDLALSEIRAYGANSLQVTRRMSALLAGLESLVPAVRLDAVQRHQRLLEARVGQEFEIEELRVAALTPDRIGLGGSAGQQARWEAARDR
jgi:uncharacterized membrane protein